MRSKFDRLTTRKRNISILIILTVVTDVVVLPEVVVLDVVPAIVLCVVVEAAKIEKKI